MHAHSLAAAVRDGTITNEAAFCGLKPDDVEQLYEHHPDALVLVRLRSSKGDDRDVLSIRKLWEWRRAKTPRRLHSRWWYYEDIRDVMAVPLSDGYEHPEVVPDPSKSP